MYVRGGGVRDAVASRAGNGTVHIFSRFDLVAHTVATGLAGRGLRTERADGQETTLGTRSAHVRDGDVAVLIDDLRGYAAVRWACGLVAAHPVPWLVLTAAPPGPVWGALLQNGATAVLSGTASTDEVEAALVELLDGGDAMDPATRAEMLATWAVANEQQERLAERMEQLTSQERRVLVQLYDGVVAGVIADRAGVAETTVRSQIKAVLRKLGVHSQIAAVAALHDHLEFVRSWGLEPRPDVP